MASLDLTQDVVTLTESLCNIESVSLNEAALADAIETELAKLDHLEVVRDGNSLVARTSLGRDERIVLAGHIDTVPLTSEPANLPVKRVDGKLWGRGTTDMKGGVAVQLKLAHDLVAPNRDVTFVFYEGEEIEDQYNGLGRIARTRPDLLEGAAFAVLLEPTNGGIEGGCKGTLRVHVRTKGLAAHSARPWKGDNAIHRAADILNRLREYEPQTVNVDGLDYHEGLNAVNISGGIAGNVIPDACTVTVNYRFAPDKSADEALAYVTAFFDGFDLECDDLAGGARPGLDRLAAKAFVEALDLPVVAKEGWTDVARFSAVGVPAVNFGPGDPNVAHMDDEWCSEDQIVDALEALTGWLA
ncbi:succinyl-diaminopimelate desuccinylase [Dermacoccus sp. PAMC28757]|uniref:succinyl-diaminopimelate desuccinylase n=1 Tax=Dermacoccus sp. PAMC28757 TaxID=2762331 RepID=UPI00164D578A|nr:succinyl-diaminopimelate desuccinylase [Dermacoccus sp. PAMC28757]QNK52634.1 succinyl-diaminopimelate desuccinylase [Dermacoccus sp. PAMC28757]